MSIHKPISLLDREIERKVDDAVKAAIGAGKKPSDMGRREFEAIAEHARKTMSPEAFRKVAMDGLEIMVKCVFGEMIAERLWTSGNGYGATHQHLRTLAKGIGLEPAAEAPEWLHLFREDLGECTLQRLNDTYKCAGRFRPLLVGEPADALLGEVATRKAMEGDPLALAFLSGRPA